MAAGEPELWVTFDGAVDAVPTAECRHVAHLREAIKEKFKPLLDHVPAAYLVVSYIDERGDSRDLHPRDLIDDVPKEKELVVRVNRTVVATPSTTSGASCSPTWRPGVRRAAPPAARLPPAPRRGGGRRGARLAA
jgi:hypothetical protein